MFPQHAERHRDDELIESCENQGGEDKEVKSCAKDEEKQSAERSKNKVTMIMLSTLMVYLQYVDRPCWSELCGCNRPIAVGIGMVSDNER